MAATKLVPHTFETVKTIRNIDRILTALKTPKTSVELAELLHMSPLTMRRYISHLRAKPNRRVRACKWRIIAGKSIPQFIAGNRPDAIRKPLTGRENSAKHQAKVKASPELSERRHRYNAAKWAIKKAKRAPSGWAAALGVSA